MSDDFAEDTRQHIGHVAARLDVVCQQLRQRGMLHDKSKFSDAEFPIYSKVVGKLRGLPWGSDAYEEQIKALGSALAHHHGNNRHHPEHYGNGVNGMDLIDIVEMYCDWAAATLRHENGDLRQSIEINIAKYGMEGPLGNVLRNTWLRYGGFTSTTDALTGQ